MVIPDVKSSPGRPRVADKVILSISGMHCASCVNKIEKALSEAEGVLSAAVHLPSKTATVEFDPQSMGADRLKEIVQGQGYTVLGLSRTYRDAEVLSQTAEDSESGMLRRRLWVGAVLWAIIMLEQALGFSVYTSWALATIIQFWCGWHFHRGFWESLSARRADMNTLVSISTWAAYLFSTWMIFSLANLPMNARQHQLEAVAGLIVMVTLGRWLESRLRKRTNEAVRRMLRMAPKTVRLLRNGKEVILPLGEAKVGERMIVRPGELIGLDGIVEEGYSTIDESLVTGEGLPVEKNAGARVYGGTMNKTGALVVTIDRTGADTTLSKIIEAVRASAASKAPVQKIVDRVAAVFVPAVILIALFASGMWLWKGPEPRTIYGFTVLVAVLSVACPCALGLATPMAIIIGMGRAAELGIYLRNAEVLEKVGRLDVVLFDKTGTLTEGTPSVAEIITSPGYKEEKFLRYAVTAESRSEHPYAAAIRRRAERDKIEPGPINSFEAFAGRGVRVSSKGETLLMGSLVWLSSQGVAVDEAAGARLKTVSGPVLALAVDGKFAGAVVMADKLRVSAREAVMRLEAMGLNLILVSGDRRQSVLPIAVELGIGNVRSAMLPEEKARVVSDLQKQGKRVAMVGEGFNDAPALSQADVGIALATGTDVAVESADITLMRPDLKQVAAAILISRKIRRVIRENLLWAFLYNALLLPVAAGALYPSFGLVLRPQYAGAAMALSSISVILNSMKLRRFKA